MHSTQKMKVYKTTEKQRERANAYYRAHKEHVLEYAREYRKRDYVIKKREELRSNKIARKRENALALARYYSKMSDEELRDAHKKQCRAYYLKNREKILARMKARRAEKKKGKTDEVE